ncbi:PREDICTED: claudin-4-like [Poecilia mexicana]|uniref:Claudin n=1 Tax=Poecilia mexicana TaxID=48701 RepID=A0A3B3XVK4_9TELE|nr:PREDICTED: claudin-4-like [Poecilia mexicana]
MRSSAAQMVCLAFGALGLIGVMRCCTVPQWKMSSFIGSNIVTSQVNYEGLWMSCVTQSTGQQQCKVYDSMLVLTSDLQAGRPMTVISCILCGLSLLILLFGADFTTCVQNQEAKPEISLAAAVGLLLADLLVIIPVSWSAHNTVTHNQMYPTSQKIELGECIYIGWAAGVILILAGGLLCCFSRSRSNSSGGTATYYSNRASVAYDDVM